MIIFKFIKNIILAVIIIAILTVPICVYFVKFNSESFLGENLKKVVMQNNFLIGFMNLDSPGDARFLYLKPDGKSISVRIIPVNSKMPDLDADLWVNEMISQTLNKDAEISVTNNVDYPVNDHLKDGDLNNLHNLVKKNDAADLYIIYTSSYNEIPSSVGLVLHRDTIFIFKDAIDGLTEKGVIKDVLERTTIMHEWGHLLGMDHVSDEKCIMDEQADVYDTPPLGKKLPTEYCWEELQSLDQS
ncbi:MAG TPA: hypothetical protein VI819_00175 [Patescibacteria group bacterium]|nr:hypothetical protein [Patescibacteria group bacterium]